MFPEVELEVVVVVVVVEELVFEFSAWKKNSLTAMLEGGIAIPIKVKVSGLKTSKSTTSLLM